MPGYDQYAYDRGGINMMGAGGYGYGSGGGAGTPLGAIGEGLQAGLAAYSRQVGLQKEYARQKAQLDIDAAMHGLRQNPNTDQLAAGGAAFVADPNSPYMKSQQADIAQRQQERDVQMLGAGYQRDPDYNPDFANHAYGSPNQYKVDPESPAYMRAQGLLNATNSRALKNGVAFDSDGNPIFTPDAIARMKAENDRIAAQADKARKQGDAAQQNANTNQNIGNAKIKNLGTPKQPGGAGASNQIPRGMTTIGSQIDKAMAPYKSQSDAIYKGLQVLNNNTITPQTANELAQDYGQAMSGIKASSDYKINAMEYDTVFGKIEKTLQTISGDPKNAMTPGVKQYLKDAFGQLNTILSRNAASSLENVTSGYTDIPNDNLQKLIKGKKSQYQKVFGISQGQAPTGQGLLTPSAGGPQGPQSAPVDPKLQQALQWVNDPANKTNPRYDYWMNILKQKGLVK